ncbi:hypothetical protein UFOVP605_27 [uncultured Caudovirales phage]|uniref:Uncharacterized protein n=1 Tax=uncultured Caudovirales phage TaxID=2100421 RepID=A0A6J5N6T4_9CAUD|nr:hypothetical protein UFOVP605_27 [uncultured Caudovirales phage]
MNLVPFEHQMTLATAFAKSRLFGIETPEQALALMALCEAEGLHPAIAIRDFHIINGKPALKADAMLQRFMAAGGKVEWLEYSDAVVSGQFSHPAGGTVTITWGKAEAQRAGLLNKPQWKNYPRQMMRARCISEGCRTVFPGVAVGVYTVEEVRDFPPMPISRASKEPVKAITHQAFDESVEDAEFVGTSPELEIRNAKNLDELKELFKKYAKQYKESGNPEMVAELTILKDARKGELTKKETEE